MNFLKNFWLLLHFYKLFLITTTPPPYFADGDTPLCAVDNGTPIAIAKQQTSTTNH